MTGSALQAVQFAFEEQPVRVVEIDEKPYWVAADVAGLLGYNHVPNMVRMLREGQKGVHLVNTLGGEQSLTVITEGGLWRCILRSKKPEAERFAEWVEEDLLPTLRRTGRYIVAANDPTEAVTPEQMDRRALWRDGLQLVREARIIGGRVAARRAWAVAELPDVFEDEQAALPELRVSEAHRPIGDWIGERCELAPGARTRASELYADFERWCDGRGMEARGIGSFGKMLGAFGVGAVKSNGMWRVGIRLRS